MLISGGQKVLATFRFTLTITDNENKILAVNKQKIGIHRAELIYTPVNIY